MPRVRGILLSEKIKNASKAGNLVGSLKIFKKEFRKTPQNLASYGVTPTKLPTFKAFLSFPAVSLAKRQNYLSMLLF